MLLYYLLQSTKRDVQEFFHLLSPHSGHMGLLEPIPAVFLMNAGSTPDKSAHVSLRT